MTVIRPVVIVGAGPVGLTAALALAVRGMPSIVLDRGEGLPCTGSRSIAVARWSLETLERLGCGRRIAAEGVTWTLGRTYFRDRELFQTRFPGQGEELFPPFVNLGQARVEQILLERVAQEPLVDARWCHEVITIDQTPSNVVARVRTPDGEVELETDWLLGCDGQHSTVRELSEIEFRGHSHPDKFLIVDLRAELPFPLERRFFFDHPGNPGRQVLIHPQPDNVWRIDWQVPRDLDLTEERRSGRLERRIRDVIGPVPYEIVWESLYVFHQRRAARFRDGRVFLVGDAAHVFAPFGGRGMNSGIDDAENLAWKLWLVTTGRAPDALLDSYQTERGAAADHNLAVTGSTMRFMVPRSTISRFRRRVLLRSCVHVASLRRFVNSGRLSVPFSYPDSPICPGAGQPAPDAAVVLGGRRSRLRDQIRDGFLVLRFGRDGEPLDEIRSGLERTREIVPCRHLFIVPSGGTAPSADTIVDPDGSVAAGYQVRPGTFVLIRPDGHLAGSRYTDDPGDVAGLVRLAAGHRVEAAEGGNHAVSRER